jgi:hypothetical protein
MKNLLICLVGLIGCQAQIPQGFEPEVESELQQQQQSLRVSSI